MLSNYEIDVDDISLKELMHNVSFESCHGEQFTNLTIHFCIADKKMV